MGDLVRDIAEAHAREFFEEFGLVANGDPRLEGDTVTLPSVRSIRSSRRVGPDGPIVFDLIAEVAQLRTLMPV